MNKLDYKHNLGDLVTTKRHDWESHYFGIITERRSMDALTRVYRVHWTESGPDTRWIYESNLLAVQKVDNEV